MSAKKTGGTAGRQRAKDAAMAAELKRLGVERKVARCPVCNHVVAVKTLDAHIISCKG